MIRSDARLSEIDTIMTHPRVLHANVSIVGDSRLVFNTHGKRYRLVVAVNYHYRMCYVRFVGTHRAYDRIDATTV